jgi:apolipoprotein D and lipocalin family protein
MKKLFLLLLLWPMLLAGCAGAPEGIVVVDNFKLDRYLGTWYEIARIENRFERGSEQVSAIYSLRKDGMVQVLNKGYYPEKKKWKTAEGKAKFAGDPNVGALKVSFFGPFYGPYTVFALDHDNYTWAMVTASSRDYFWILARTPPRRSALRQTARRGKSAGLRHFAGYAHAAVAQSPFFPVAVELNLILYSVRRYTMQITTDIKPVTWLKANAASLLDQINDTRRPVIITQNGEPKAVLQDPKSYEDMRNALGLLKLFAQGEEQVRSGQVAEQDSVFMRLEEQLNRRA